MVHVYDTSVRTNTNIARRHGRALIELNNLNNIQGDNPSHNHCNNHSHRKMTK